MFAPLLALFRPTSLAGLLAIIGGIASGLRGLNPLAYLRARRAQHLLAQLQALLAAFQAGTLPPEPDLLAPAPRRSPAPALPDAPKAPRHHARPQTRRASRPLPESRRPVVQNVAATPIPAPYAGLRRMRQAPARARHPRRPARIDLFSRRIRDAAPTRHIHSTLNTFV